MPWFFFVVFWFFFLAHSSAPFQSQPGAQSISLQVSLSVLFQLRLVQGRRGSSSERLRSLSWSNLWGNRQALRASGGLAASKHT
jgi:hypothetical protein